MRCGRLRFGGHRWCVAGGHAALCSGSADQRISGGWCSHGGAEARREQREESTTGPGGQLAIGVSRALACVLNTRGFPQVLCTAPVIHPVRVHKFPLQAS
jgi:hypothetical protein